MITIWISTCLSHRLMDQSPVLSVLSLLVNMTHSLFYLLLLLPSLSVFRGWAAEGVSGHHAHLCYATLYSAPEDTGKVCLPKSIVYPVNKARLLMRLWHWPRSHLWNINERNTISEFLKLVRPWMKPWFVSPRLQKLIMHAHIPWGALQRTFTLQFLSYYFQITFSVHILHSNPLIWWRDGRGRGLYSIAQTNNLTPGPLVACLVVSNLVLKQILAERGKK